MLFSAFMTLFASMVATLPIPVLMDVLYLLYIDNIADRQLADVPL